MRSITIIGLLAALAAVATAQQPPSTDAGTHLTIYNDDFAVARTTVPLNLHAGVNEALTTAVTSHLEPDSVVLRDPSTHNPIPVLEQNYDAGVVNQEWLLEKYEGKTIDFQTYGMQVIETTTGEHKTLPATVVQGRIIRAGNQPLIEVNGKMQFQLPGLPIFPVETDGLVLKPTLRWQIDAKQEARIPAELDYITHGLQWHATYNVIVPQSSDTTAQEAADLLGWVTIENNSGAEFPQATIELMAGDVAKIRDKVARPRAMMALSTAAVAQAPEVTQQAFDEYHLYDLHRTMTLRNGETKQVQFIDAANVTVQRTYEFEGTTSMGELYPGYHNDQPAFGMDTETHVAVREQFKNTTANHLGMPLPAGRMRVYRRDANGAVQFVGESTIPHTPAEQQVELTTGHAFDVTARQRQTDFKTNQNGHTIDESFAVHLANQKAQPVTVHVIENMNRSQNWEITAKSSDFTKRDSARVDFPVTVPSKGETTLTYSVHYTW